MARRGLADDHRLVFSQVARGTRTPDPLLAKHGRNVQRRTWPGRERAQCPSKSNNVQACWCRLWVSARLAEAGLCSGRATKPPACVPDLSIVPKHSPVARRRGRRRSFGTCQFLPGTRSSMWPSLTRIAGQYLLSFAMLWQDGTSRRKRLVGSMSAGGSALVIASSTLMACRSLEAQRANTNVMLETQADTDAPEWRTVRTAVRCGTNRADKQVCCAQLECPQ